MAFTGISLKVSADAVTYFPVTRFKDLVVVVEVLTSKSVGTALFGPVLHAARLATSNPVIRTSKDNLYDVFL
jgi:hypothetical protein